MGEQIFRILNGIDRVKKPYPLTPALSPWEREQEETNLEVLLFFSLSQGERVGVRGLNLSNALFTVTYAR